MSKKTVAAIIESGNDYLIAVKANQPKLLQRIKTNIGQSNFVDSYFTEEKNRGRLEKRYVELYDNVEQIDPELWKGVQRLVFVHRTGFRADKGSYSEKHYYILSKPIDNASQVAKAVRGHWLIENQLHYVKDVNYKEDKNKIRDGNPAAILSLFQDISINFYKCLGYKSVKKGTIHFANKIKKLFNIIKTEHISDL